MSKFLRARLNGFRDIKEQNAHRCNSYWSFEACWTLRNVFLEASQYISVMYWIHRVLGDYLNTLQGGRFCDRPLRIEGTPIFTTRTFFLLLLKWVLAIQCISHHFFSQPTMNPRPRSPLNSLPGACDCDGGGGSQRHTHQDWGALRKVRETFSGPLCC